MYLKNAISVLLAITAVLSIFMLQMGSDSETSVLLPILSIPIISAGVWLVDIKRRFALSEGWSNVLILLAVGLHIGRLIQSPSEFLAYSIANILVWVQIVLFYRQKDVLTCYHILTLAFIQGGVACVFQQSSLFAPLLLGFAFAVLCSLSLLFLNQERHYYRSHAFLKPAFGRGEKIKRVTVGDLAVLAVKTVIVTPLMILLGYQWKEWLEKDESESKRLTVHSKRGDTSETESPPTGLFHFWESIDSPADGPSGLYRSDAERSKGRKSRSNEPAADLSTELAPGQAVGAGGSTEAIELRWPLLRVAPLFSGARPTDTRFLIGRRILSRLLWGAALSLVAGGIVFFSFPRFNDVEVGSVRFGHDQWRGAPPQIRSVTGFSEQMKLGEMGPSGTNYESVLRIRLSDVNSPETPVLSDGAPVYLRGTVLVRYEGREWFAPKPTLEPVRSLHYRTGRRYSRRPRRSEEIWYPKLPASVFSSHQNDYGEAIFSARNRVVAEEMVLFPMSTPIIFTVWPFFQFDRGVGIISQDRYVRSDRDAANEMRLTLFSNAFDSNGQVDLTPVQELPNRILSESLEIDVERLPRLVETAKRWDAESNLPADDLIGRAKYIEGKFRDSGEFVYSRSGVERDSAIDPLDDFISEHREGHCEYFAGALAMALRAVGIPTRVVVGFCPVYQPELDGFSIVRQSDAHTWVEAYIRPESLPAGTFDPASEFEPRWWADGGWLRLDGTPERSEELIRSVSINLRAWREFFSHWWNDYVLNYNGGRQYRAIYEPVKNLFLWCSSRVSSLLGRLNPFDSESDRLRQLTDPSSADRIDWGEWGTLLTAILVFCALAAAAVWGVRRLKGRRASDVSAQMKAERIASGFFLRLEKCLARYGAVRLSGETPREYLSRFLHSPGAAQFQGALELQNPPEPFDRVLAAVVEVYYRVRFGLGTVEDAERARFDAFFHTAENLPRKG